MERQQLQQIIEGALLAYGQPMTLDKMLTLFNEEEEQLPAKDELKAVLQDIEAGCSGRGFELKQVASGWRFQVSEDTANWVNRLWDEKPQRYSRALLETLALIAYRQPITRGDIEEIRGVSVSSHIVKTLVEREWIKVVGHRDVPGRPALYATTRQFLDYFNLKSLDELPSLGEIADIEALDAQLDLSGVLEGLPAVAKAEATETDSSDEAAQTDVVDTEQETVAGNIDTAELQLVELQPAQEDNDFNDAFEAEGITLDQVSMDKTKSLFGSVADDEIAESSDEEKTDTDTEGLREI